MVQATVKKRLVGRVVKLRRAVHVDTQRIRAKTVHRLNEIFRISSDYARGKVVRVTDENGKERPLSILERQFWARIAAYTAQIMLNVTKGIDERQMDLDLDRLEQLLIEGEAKKKAEDARTNASDQTAEQACKLA